MNKKIKSPREYQLQGIYEWALINPGVMHLRKPNSAASSYIKVGDNYGYYAYLGFWASYAEWFPTLDVAINWCEQGLLEELNINKDKELNIRDREKYMENWFN